MVNASVKVERTLHLGFGLLLLAVAMCAAARPWTGPPWLSVMPLFLALALTFQSSNRSTLVAAYVVVVFLAFVVTPLLVGRTTTDLAPVWRVIAIWFLAWSGGQWLEVSLRPADSGERRDRRRFFIDQASPTAVSVVAVISLATQMILLHRRVSGYAAQLAGLQSSGPTVLLTLIGPVAVATAFWLARPPGGSRSRTWWLSTLLMVGLQAYLLTASGYRAAAPVFVLTTWLVGTRWERSIRLSIQKVLGPILLVVVVSILFGLGYQARVRAVRAQGTSRSVDNPILRRLDESTFLSAAIDRSSWLGAKQPLAIQAQVEVFIPRLLWPSKPNVDPGQYVARFFFDGIPGSKTSATITWLGDLYVQGGLALIIAVGFILGFVSARWLSRHTRFVLRSISCYFLVVTALLSLESPVLLAVAQLLRIYLVFVACLIMSEILLKITRRRGDTEPPSILIRELTKAEAV